MANQIQIKRSNTSATPSNSLQSGELAYSYNSNALFIGAQSGVGSASITVGGYKYGYLDQVSAPGTLTSNSALIVDANSFISNVYTQGLILHPSEGTVTVNSTVSFINSISSFSNSSQLGSISSTGSNNELTTSWAIKNYVTQQVINATTPAGTNGEFQYNNSGTLAGTSNFVYNNVLGIVSIGNTSSNVQMGYITTTQATLYSYGSQNNYIQIAHQNQNSGTSASTDYAAYNDDTTLNTFIDMGINSSTWSNTSWTVNGPNDGYLYTGNGSLSIGTNTASKYLNFFTGGSLAANERLRITDTALVIANGVNIVANGSAGASGQLLSSNGSSLYWTSVAGVNTAAQYTWSNTQTFQNTVTFNGNVIIGSALTVNNELVVGNGIYTNSTFANNPAYGDGIVLDYVSGNGRLSVGAADGLTLYTGGVGNVAMSVSNTYGLWVNGVVNATAFTVNTSLTANSSGLFVSNTTGTVNAANITVGTNFIANSSGITTTGTFVNAASATIYGLNGVFSGNLTVSGTITTLNTTQLTIGDNIVELASNNGLASADNVDTGWFSPANTSGTLNYAAFGRIASSSTSTNPYFKLFTQTTNPNTSTTFTPTSTGTLEAYLVPYGVGGGFVANSSNVQITANSTLGVNITANSLVLTTALVATSGGTGVNTYAAGDLLYAGTANPSALSKLSIPGSSANGQVLQIVNNLPAYGTLDGGTF